MDLHQYRYLNKLDRQSQPYQSAPKHRQCGWLSADRRAYPSTPSLNEAMAHAAPVPQHRISAVAQTSTPQLNCQPQSLKTAQFQGADGTNWPTTWRACSRTLDTTGFHTAHSFARRCHQILNSGSHYFPPRELHRTHRFPRPAPASLLAAQLTLHIPSALAYSDTDELLPTRQQTLQPSTVAS